MRPGRRLPRFGAMNDSSLPYRAIAAISGAAARLAAAAFLADREPGEALTTTDRP